MNTITNTNYSSPSYSNPSSYKKPSTTNNPQTAIKHKTQPDAIYSVANRYDVKNMSTKELISMSEELYKIGEISLLEHSIISLDSSYLDDGDIYLSKKVSKDGYDMIEEFKTRAELSEKLSDTNSLKNHNEILKILIKMDGLKAGPLDIMV